MNEGIYVEKTDQFKRTAALVGYALIFCGMLWDVVMPLISRLLFEKYTSLWIDALWIDALWIAVDIGALLAILAIYIWSMFALVRLFQQKSASPEETFQRQCRERWLALKSLYICLAISTLCGSSGFVSLLVVIAYAHIDAAKYLGHRKLLMYEIPLVLLQALFPILLMFGMFALADNGWINL